MDGRSLSPAAVRAARNELGMSQARLAEGAGINRTYLCQFENGRRILDESEAFTLSEFLVDSGIDFDHLVDAQGVSDAKPEREAIRGCVERGYRVLDGMLVPAALEEDQAEELVAELQRLRRRAHELWRMPRQSVLDAMFSEENHKRELCETVLAMVLITERLQGRDTLDPAVGEDEDTIAAAML